jgi:HlyD family secretion protein
MSTENVEGSSSDGYIVSIQTRVKNLAAEAVSENGDIRLGWIVVLLFFGVFLGFASFIRLDSAAYAAGTVSVAGNRQAVQHRDGGIVASLHVTEGQHVQAGQVLIELAGAEVAANERALAAQVIGLQAERARLFAQRAGSPSVVPPPEFATLTGNDRQIADAAMRLEANALLASRGSIQSQKAVLSQQQAQVRERITGLSQQLAENEKQRALFDDQLGGLQVLVDKGYASINRVRELERARGNVLSDRANLTATAAAAREQIGEAQMQSLTLDTRSQQDVSEQLRRNEDALGDAQPKWLDFKRRLAQTQIRATATGHVVGLKVITVGAVIAPGDNLMEVVPDAVPLVIEANFNPTDADDIYVGEEAEIRFPSLHERDLPVFKGKITRLSADSFTDERTGTRFYTGEVKVSPKDLEEIKQVKAGGGIKAGMPVQVLVPLRKRTLLQYLLEPINQALWRSGHEH